MYNCMTFHINLSLMRAIWSAPIPQNISLSSTKGNTCTSRTAGQMFYNHFITSKGKINPFLSLGPVPLHLYFNNRHKVFNYLPDSTMQSRVLSVMWNLNKKQSHSQPSLAKSTLLEALPSLIHFSLSPNLTWVNLSQNTSLKFQVFDKTMSLCSLN